MTLKYAEWMALPQESRDELMWQAHEVAFYEAAITGMAGRAAVERARILQQTSTMTYYDALRYVWTKLVMREDP